MIQIVEHSLRCSMLLYEIDQEIRMEVPGLTLVNNKTHYADTFKGLLIEGDFS